MENRKNQREDDVKDIIEFSVYEELPLVTGMIASADDELIGAVTEIVSEEHFYNPLASKLFKTVKDIYLKNEKIDMSEIHRKSGVKASEIAGLASKYGGEVFSSGQAVRYADKVKEGYNRRRLLRLVIDYEKKIVQDDFGGVMSELETKVLDISKETIGKSAKRIPQLINNLNEEIQVYKDNKDFGYKTGYPIFDKRTEGFIIPHIWIIGGYTGTGKTFFTLSSLVGLMRSGIRPVLFSTENSATRNVLRLLGCMTGMTEMKILKGNLDENEEQQLEKARQELVNFPLVIYDDVYDTSKIRVLARKHRVQDKSNLIVVDYIQNLNTKGSDGEIYKQMSQVALDLQKISIELNMGLIGVSQISNVEAMKNSDEIMTFKGAGEITAISDIAIWLRRDKKDSAKLGAHIKKIRHGVPGKVEFSFFSKRALSENAYVVESESQEESW